MHAPRTVPRPGFLLRWGGLLILVLSILAGILGMHMIGGAQASPMPPAHAISVSSGTTAVATTMVAPADSHPAASPAMSIAHHAKVSDAPKHLGSNAICGCSPSGCEMPMAGHGSCIPAAGAATPAAPQPALVPDPSAGTTSSDYAGYKFAGRLPGPPSLTQLSISRT